MLYFNLTFSSVVAHKKEQCQNKQNIANATTASCPPLPPCPPLLLPPSAATPATPTTNIYKHHLLILCTHTASPKVLLYGSLLLRLHPHLHLLFHLSRKMKFRSTMEKRSLHLHLCVLKNKQKNWPKQFVLAR